MNTATLAHERVPPAPARFGMIVFLASEAMLFAGLISGYIVLRLAANGFPWQEGHAWPPSPDLPALPVLFTGVNTVFLVTSSFTLHFAEAAVRRGRTGLLWLMVTILLGSLFLGIQAYEWTHLHHEGLWFHTGGIYASSFFVITGFHGAHVAVGVLLILWCFFRQVFTRCFTPGRHTALANVALYWHFVDVVWIFLFILLYGI